MWNGQLKLLSSLIVVGLCFSATARCIGLQDENRPLRTLDSHFPFLLPRDAEEWKTRAEGLRLQVRMSLGLWPLPERTPLNAVIHGRIDMGDYSVEKVYFESFPGFFVTGSLYRSTKESESPRPAILCPHGHYSNGRFYDAGADEIKRAIANGEETFESNARSPLQARCAHLARMGCTVFHYDMIGYADSQQIPASVAHNFSKQRPDENGADGWGFFSPRAEMHLQSIMGLQTWNSMRAIDFVQSLPEVDPDRIGVTGSSGGGTQSFILAALDDRVTASFPAVMVSTGMQGGCTCENCCNLRVGTGNVEIAALFAPKPMGLSAANDWTRTMPEDGFPQLQRLYQMLGKPENVFLTARTNFPHGYNQVARRVMYAWFDKHLKITGQDPDIAEVEQGNLAEDSPWRERENRFLTKAELTVWDDSHPAPKGGVAIEYAVNSHWSASRQREIQRQIAGNHESEKASAYALLAHPWLRQSFTLAGGPKVSTTLNGFPDISAKFLRPNFWEHGPYPILWCYPGMTAKRDDHRPVFLVTSRPMEENIREPSNALGLLLRLISDVVVMGGSEMGGSNAVVENGREAAAYSMGYNRSRLADAALAITSTIESATSKYLPEKKETEYTTVDMILVDSAAPIGILAAAASPAKIGTIILRDDFRFEEVVDFTNPNFLPGSLVLGDVPGLLAIARPQQIIVIGEIREDMAARFSESKGEIVSVKSEEEAITRLVRNRWPEEK